MDNRQTSRQTAPDWRALLLAPTLLCMLPGCAHFHSAPDPRETLTPPPALLAEFSMQDDSPLRWQVRERAAKCSYSTERIELEAPLDSSGTNRFLTLDCFLPVESDRPAVILVLPIMGGSKYPIENYFASYFAKKGMAAIIVHREKKKEPDSLEEIDDLLRQTILDNKRAIDWIVAQGRFDPERIGVFGISMGAIKGAMLAPLEPRIRAAALGLVGGDIPYLLSHTTEPGVRRQRELYLKEKQTTAEALETNLRRVLTCDPNRFAPYVDPQRTLLVLATCDKVVPFKKGLELRLAMGKPESIFVTSGHFTSLLFAPYIRRQCYGFFKRHLQPAAASATGTSNIERPTSNIELPITFRGTSAAQ